MTEKELQESRKLFGQALAEALAEKYDEELKEAPDVKLPVDHDVTINPTTTCSIPANITWFGVQNIDVKYWSVP